MQPHDLGQTDINSAIGGTLIAKTDSDEAEWLPPSASHPRSLSFLVSPTPSFFSPIKTYPGPDNDVESFLGPGYV